MPCRFSYDLTIIHDRFYSSPKRKNRSFKFSPATYGEVNDFICIETSYPGVHFEWWFPKCRPPLRVLLHFERDDEAENVYLLNCAKELSETYVHDFKLIDPEKIDFRKDTPEDLIRGIVEFKIEIQINDSKDYLHPTVMSDDTINLAVDVMYDLYDTLEHHLKDFFDCMHTKFNKHCKK